MIVSLMPGVLPDWQCECQKDAEETVRKNPRKVGLTVKINLESCFFLRSFVFLSRPKKFQTVADTVLMRCHIGEHYSCETDLLCSRPEYQPASSHHLIGSNSLCACSPATPSNNTRPLGNKLSIRKVRSEASRPGMSSARKTTFIPGRAHISATLDFSRRCLRREPVLFLIKTAPIAPRAPAVKAIPPNKRFVAFFISRSQI